jgi:hypothetical protein
MIISLPIEPPFRVLFVWKLSFRNVVGLRQTNGARKIAIWLGASRKFVRDFSLSENKILWDFFFSFFLSHFVAEWNAQTFVWVRREKKKAKNRRHFTNAGPIKRWRSSNIRATQMDKLSFPPPPISTYDDTNCLIYFPPPSSRHCYYTSVLL